MEILTGRLEKLDNQVKSDAQGRLEVEISSRDVQKRLETHQKRLEIQFNSLSGETQNQMEAFEAKLDSAQQQVQERLETFAQHLEKLKAQLENCFSALNAKLAEQSQFAKDHIAGLAALLEIQAKSTDEQFAKRIEAHEHIIAQMAGLAEELRGYCVERDATRARIAEISSLMHEQQSTIENFRQSLVFRSLQSLHLVPAKPTN